MILFISLPPADDKAVLGVTRISLQQMPRWCPLCHRASIIGHGQRRKPAHDGQHEYVWVRRGRCRLCRKTFTILPSWSLPYGHYTLRCRQQAWDAQSAPTAQDGNSPRLSARTPLVCLIPARCVDGPVAE